MSDPNKHDPQELLRNALVRIKDLKAKLQEHQFKASEPIAIIGMACRFPAGGTDPEAFWRALETGVDGVRRIPQSRWSRDEGTSTHPATKWAALLDSFDTFDPAFFGISPREAARMDPQQRLLLEVVWEALERSGQDLPRQMHSQTAVFLGMCNSDYWQLSLDAPQLNAYSLLGNMCSTAAGRISFTFGFEGPCITLDTACSSSLTAVHLACQSLRNGESNLALAAGVNLILAPPTMMMLNDLNALSPDGRCKTFDASANGYARGEGCGVVVLKRISDAERDGDAILAIIRSSVVNQDGHSTGMTAPNVLAQRAMLQRALDVARLSGDDIGYVETHGTGTPLGDPIEFEALREVLGKPRTDGTTCVLGALKTNVGHMEGAAGIGGLIKAILCLRHEAIPKNLHFKTLNPRISLEGTPFVIPTDTLPWKSSSKPRRAAVSSFGISGTNAHVILEEAPAPSKKEEREVSFHVVPLSAKTSTALVALATSYSKWLRQTDANLYDIAYTASLRRSHFEHRLGVAATTKEEVAEQLDAFVSGQSPAGFALGKIANRPPNVIFVFSGQGSQWLGMGRQLYREEPVFRDALAACDAALRKETGYSIIDELHKPENASRLAKTLVAQPALFAIEVALAKLLQSWGIVPTAVIGHSVGEIAAAHIAGMLDLEQAARLVSVRARIMQKAAGRGKMVSVTLTEEEARNAIGGLEDRIGIAAVNDPSSVVLSGDIEAIDKLLEQFAAQGVLVRPLRVDYAFHSPQMQPLAAEFLIALGKLDSRPATITMISTVTGKQILANEMDAEYWARNIRQTVRCADAVAAMASHGTHLFVEVGPHPVLFASIEQTLVARNNEGSVIPTLRRDQDEQRSVLKVLGALHVQGVGIDWKQFYRGGGRVVELPTYPWQRDRYWIESPSSTGIDIQATGQDKIDHPLLHAAISLPENAGVLLTGRLSLREHSWLADHRVTGQVIFPGTGFLELALVAANRFGLSNVEELTLQKPLSLSWTKATALRVMVEPPDDAGRRQIVIYSRAEGEVDEIPWTRHAQGIVGPFQAERVEWTQWPPPGTTPLELEGFYSQLAARGLEYGPAFRGIRALWRGADNIYAEVSLPESVIDEAGSFMVHPALFDAAIQSLAGTMDMPHGYVFLPSQLSGLTLFRAVGANVCVQARIDVKPGSETLFASIVLADAAGNLVARLSDIQLTRTSTEWLSSAQSRQTIFEYLHIIDWQESTISKKQEPVSETWLLLDAKPESSWPMADRMQGLGSRLISCNLSTWLEAPSSLETYSRVVWLCNDHDSVDDDRSPAAHAERHAIEALRLVRVLLQQEKPPQFVVVTRGAFPVEPGERVVSMSASVWGFARTLMLEYPDLSCKMVDIDPDQDLWECIWQELSCTESENQIAWRGGKRFVPCLEKLPVVRDIARPKGSNYALASADRGELSNLRLEAASRVSPRSGEIEIKVQASGLNFRDVLNALGMYPGEAGPLGGECAGTVVTVGAGVEHFRIGDRVMAIVPGAFQAFVTVDARLVAPIPKGLSFAQAATIPAVFLSAYYALYDLAKLQTGEYILIHAAAGGVGMAATQIARLRGANVLATASRSKWSQLHALGVEHVANSRDLEFVKAFREATGGHGVDVVLNSLTGEFVDASLSLVRSGGRFLEMGKTDIRSAEAISRQYPDVEYRAFDLSQIDPERISSMLSAIVDAFEAGELKPLPVRAFAMTEAQTAFRFMAQARHTGKIALLALPNLEDLASGTVLITGGFGALGFHVARRFWERYRVAHLLLVGRHAPSPEKMAEIEQWRQQGAHVSVAQVDIADRAAVQALVDSITAERPLRAIIHAAGVIDDGILLEQTPARFINVFAPKVRGAWNLFDASRDKPLDLFVLFSSAAGILGNAGQASYSAANAFLDAFATQIRSCGIHAVSLAWGPWDSGGMAATLNDKHQARLRQRGLIPLRVNQGIAFLEDALQWPHPLLVPMALDSVAVARNDVISPLLRRLAPPMASQALQRHSPSSTTVLAGIPETQRRNYLLDTIRRNAAEVLGLRDSNAIPMDRSLFELGLDSLMAVELRNRIAKALGIRIEANTVMQMPRPVDLATEILRRFEASTGQRQTITIPPIPSTSRQGITLPPISSTSRQGATAPPIPSSSRRSTLHPLSSAQSRIYFLDRMLERRETYNIQIALRVGTILSTDRLKIALAKLAGRHDQLRMQVFDGAEGPQLRILPWVEVPVEEIDLRAQQEKSFARIAHERAVVPFDLTKAPLLRITLARLDEQTSGLLLVWHHIATDGWSVGRFLRELEAFYLTPEMQFSSIPPYHELVAARRLDDTVREEHQRWWSNYLAGAEPLDLPTDHAPVCREQRGGRVAFAFGAAESDKIDSLARSIGATPFAVLLSGWALVMQRYCRQEDVTIAVISSGRTVSGSEAAIGLFVETLPVRCFLERDQSVRSNIVSIHRALFEAVAHERLPLDEMLGTLPNVRRGEIGETPLLRVSFVLEHAAWFPVTFAGAKVVQVGDAVSGDVDGTNKFDLGLAMVRHDAGYRASIEYAVDLFETATIERLAGHLRQILMAMAASPENRLSDVEMLTAAERHQLLVEWNDTSTDYPAYKCIHELFEEQVERTPEAVAVIFGGVRISYADLDAQANQLAHQLRLLGVGPDVLVGVCLERSIEMVVGFLGILKAGGAYVPLDPHYPRERLAFMLEDTNALVVLTHTRYRNALFEHHPRVLCVDSGVELSKEAQYSIPACGVRPEHLAYVMYTSGSTGTPKGVCVTHRNVVRLVRNSNYIEVRPSDRIAQASNSSFDAATFEIWGALLNGAAIVGITKEIALSPDAFAAALVSDSVNILFTTTALFNMVVRQAPTMFQALRYVLFGGEAVDPAPVRTALDRGPANLLHVYGPTETTTFATFYVVHSVLEGATTIPIGKPIANTTAYILDARGKVVPIGVPGELYIGGDGVARGYLNRLELTAERFIQDPFSSQPNARLYKTGDLCRWTSDGNIEFLGRLDHQVKIRGFRVELGEIETALLSHVAVRSCVVIAREDRPGEKRLVAYVVPNETEGSMSALRAHLGAKLPDYMIPSVFVFLDAMPLTPNGKVDRKALPAPEFDRAALSMRFVAARTRIERILTSIWSDVLGLDTIGIHDNFFELGGNSLLGIRLISRAAKAGLVLTVRQLFESPTIDGLVKALATNKTSSVRCLVPLRPSGSEIPLILTPGLAGTSMVFLALRDAVRATIPLWTFDDPHLARHPAQIATIEELAHLWVSELLDAMPDKPSFRLAGYSFGGVVAVEMARQLISLGKEVDCVLILDGGLPNSIDVAFDALTFLESLARQLGVPDAVRTGSDEHDMQEVLRCIARIVGTWQESAVDDPLAWAQAALVAAENNHGRMLQWQVRPVDTPLVVLRASDDVARIPDLGWSGALGRPVDVLYVPGDHQTMMGAPFVQTLALCIQELLEHRRHRNKQQ